MGFEQRFWKKILSVEEIKYLPKYKIGVIGSRYIAELLWRLGVGCIKYVGDHLTQWDVHIDPSISTDETDMYDVIGPKSDGVDIYSYLYPKDYLQLKKQLKGVDMIIAHRYIVDGSRVARDLGVPFMPDIISTFLPDGVEYEKIQYPHTNGHNPLVYTLTCSIQVGEMFRILTGSGMPILAPDAMVVDLTHPGYLRYVRLRVKED